MSCVGWNNRGATTFAAPPLLPNKTSTSIKCDNNDDALFKAEVTCAGRFFSGAQCADGDVPFEGTEVSID